LASYPDGVEFFINRPRNIDKADIDGWEINWQHTLDFGLGWQANYSSIDSNAVLDLDSDFSLEGLSDTYNIVVFYETDRFMIRVAHNWRENFLQNLQDQSSTLEFPEPQYTDDYKQWDISASYRINDMFRILFEGINITDEGTLKHGRYSNHFLEYIETGPRYRIGVRGTF
jgi:TonB-dependent receptor